MIIKDLDKNDKLEGDIIQDYEGSFLANIKNPDLLPDVLIEFRDYLRNIYSLDLLAPQELRKRSRTGSKLGLSGENLSAYLDTFSEVQKKLCWNSLKNVTKILIVLILKNQRWLGKTWTCWKICK